MCMRFLLAESEPFQIFYREERVPDVEIREASLWMTFRITVISFVSDSCILVGKLYYLEIALLHCQESLSSFWLSLNVGSICHWAEPFAWNIILNLEIKMICLFLWTHHLFTKHHTSFTISGLVWSTSRWPFSINTNLLVLELYVMQKWFQS